MYKAYCGGGKSSSRPAGASSTFTSSFNLSPASLPSSPSAYGIESIGSGIRGNTSDQTYQFSIIKGFSKFGAGVSTGGNNTFYGNDIYKRLHFEPEYKTFTAKEPPRGKFVNLNVGTSIALLRSSSGNRLSLGLTGRYNKITDSIGGGTALLLGTGHFSIGAGFTQEHVSNTLPWITFYSALASIRIAMVEFEYDLLSCHGTSGLEPIHILTSTWTIRRFTITAAARKLNYIHFGQVTQYHGAIQLMVNSHLGVGYLYNFIPGAHSIGAQLFF